MSGSHWERNEKLLCTCFKKKLQISLLCILKKMQKELFRIITTHVYFNEIAVSLAVLFS